MPASSSAVDIPVFKGRNALQHTVDALTTMTRLLSNTVLNPLVTGVSYAIIAHSPLLQRLAAILPAPALNLAISALKWLTIVGATRWASAWLSEVAQNNFRIGSQKHRYDWPKELAVVTGGTGGFGSLLCKGLAAKGVTVVAIDIRDSLPDDMKSNPRIHYRKLDITDPTAVERVAEEIKAAYGHPSILINNAGIQVDNTILNVPAARLAQIYGVNVLSHYYTSQAFLPAMIKERKGHVVTVASMASFVTQPTMVPYCNTKVAALSFHEGLAQETRALYKAPEILFTVVHPTFARTAIVGPFEKELKATGAVVLEPEVVANEILGRVFKGRGGQLFIAPDNKFVNTIRSWPHWISQGVFRIMEKGFDGEEILARMERGGAKLRR